MSRIGKLPIPVPSGVSANIEGQSITITGPKGSLSLDVADSVSVKEEDGSLVVTRANDESASKALHGLTRSLVNNMVTGVTEGYTKTLELVGTGYRVTAKGQDLEFALGFSHSITVKAPQGITFAVETPNKFSVIGIDKQLVGETAANIRKLRKPEPYKGKGVRYENEVIRRKAGKAGK